MSVDAVVDEVLADARPRWDARAGCLVGGLCSACGAQQWPARAVCHRCGAESIELLSLPTQATLITWSRVWIPVGAVQPPYIVGLVQCGNVRVFAHVRGLVEQLHVGDSLRVRLDPAAVPPFWVEAEAS